MTGAKRLGLGRFISCCFCLAAVDAHAFVCTRVTDGDGTGNGPSLAWTGGRQLNYTLQVNGTRQIPVTDTFDTLRRAFLVWQNLQVSPESLAQCNTLPGTDLTFVERGALGSANWAGYDFLNIDNNRNLLVFRDDEWPNPSDAVDIIALTTTTYSALTGAILDADIEFNSANFNFVTSTPSAEDTDLLNTAVHEIGHFLGLAHCNSIACGRSEVMEPTSEPGETVKRQLKCDDRAGVTFKYPAGQPNGYCLNMIDAACGMCAPPKVTALRPVVRVSERAPGRGGPSCQATANAGWWGPILGWFLWRRRTRWQAVSLFLLSLTACRGADCNGDITAAGQDVPLIVNMKLQGQVESDPWRIILATDFVDFNGDLGEGRAEFFANYSTVPRTSQPLNRIFSSSNGLSLQSASGTIALPLRFAESTVNGANLHLGTQLIDAAGNRSNCYELDLAFQLIPN